MILTREKGVAGYPGRWFCPGVSLVAMMLAALVLAAPVWGQEEKAAPPAAEAAAQAAHDADKPLLWMPEAISTYGEGVDWLFWLNF